MVANWGIISWLNLTDCQRQEVPSQKYSFRVEERGCRNKTYLLSKLTGVWWGPYLWITGCYGHQTKLTKNKVKLRAEVKLKWFTDRITILLITFLSARNCMGIFLWFSVKRCPLVAMLLFSIEIVVNMGDKGISPPTPFPTLTKSHTIYFNFPLGRKCM